VKAQIIAQDILKRDDLAIAADADFPEVEIDGEVRTTIRLPVVVVPADGSTSDLG